MFIVCLQFSVFDVPLHYNFKEAADAGRDYDIRKVWDGTLVQARPVDAVYVHIPLQNLSTYSATVLLLTTTSKSVWCIRDYAN